MERIDRFKVIYSPCHAREITNGKLKDTLRHWRKIVGKPIQYKLIDGVLTIEPKK